MSPKPDEDPLYEMDPTGRFTDRAEDYARYRPSYPAAAFDAIVREATEGLAADIGAGTGISARQLADRGITVIAVEPNAAMREAAAPHPRVEWRNGTAEDTGVETGSLDLVLCAQAFHWFRPHEAVREFHRILRPRGRLALIWNSRDVRDPLTRGYVDAIRAVHGEHPVERRPFDSEVIDRDHSFTTPTLETFAHTQELDRDGLLGRAASASYVPKDSPAFEELKSVLVALFDRHRDPRGMIRMAYVTQLYLAER